MIELTNKCNLHCFGCPNKLNIRPKGFMKLETFKDIITQVIDKYGSDIKKKRICLHGFGEPLLSPCFDDCLTYLDNRELTNVEIITNGTLLDEEKAKKLKEHSCIKIVRISLNSSNKKDMELINSGSNFNKVVNNIKFLLNSQPPFEVEIQHMVNNLTKDETKQDFVDLFGRDNFTYIRKGMHNYFGQVEHKYEYDSYNSCNGYFGRDLIVHWNGDLVGCCSDNSKSQVYGNVKKGIDNSKIEEFRRNINKLPLCKKCMEYKINSSKRLQEVIEFFGYPQELAEILLKYSKEYFEGIWDAYYPEYVREYYIAGYYAIRQMSYSQGDVFTGDIKQFLDKIKSGESVLDYGCGVGDYLIYLAQKGVKCYAIEHEGIPTKFLKYRFKKHNVDVEIIDKPKEVDYTLLISSLDHMRKPIEVARKICSLTRKEVFATPCIDETYDRPTHEKYILKDVPKAFEVINAENSRKRNI